MRGGLVLPSIAMNLLPELHLRSLCAIPEDLEAVTDVGDETPAREVGCSRGAIENIWAAAQALYRTGLYPALQLAVRRRGALVLNRALGHARGNLPGDPPDAEKARVTTRTPFRLYSASKAITAMVIHKLDELHAFHIDDRVCDYVPAFDREGKEWITIAHVLAHRAGIPNLPRGLMDLDLLARPEEIVEILAEQDLLSRPGEKLAYHAITGGFVLGEVVRHATGQDIRTVIRKEFLEPLGLRWMSYGVAPEDVGRVAADAVTGIPPLPPFSALFRRALGASLEDAVSLAQDPRFMTAVVPAANIVANAEELSAFYQCLLDEGEYRGVRVLDPRTVRRATVEQAYLDFDLTLSVPIRYGLGFMLGGRVISLFGPDTGRAFGHLGLTNVFSWADPDRALAVTLTTSGKPFLDPAALTLIRLILAISRAFPKEAEARARARARRKR